MQERVQRLRRELTSRNLNGFVALKPENRRYLSGFAGSHGALLITQSDAYLITDNRYLEIARENCPGFRCVLQEGSIEATLGRLIGDLGRIGFEDDHVTIRTHAVLSREIRAELVPSAGLVESLRLYKDASEVDAVRRALVITEMAYERLLPLIRPGVRESELAVELEYFMRKGGAERIKANFVLVSGARAALPHGQATSKLIESGDFITFDIGAIVEGYYADFTRTVVVGKASAEQRKVYQTVREAQELALAAICPHCRAEEIDRIAREHIEKAGYGGRFTHSLGHGVGLFIHEDPRMAPGSPWTLEPGMLLTVEPGIYINGWGGVRIEDMIYMTETGFENLTRSPKELLEL